MVSIISIIIILSSIFMIAVVLLQPGKGDLTATFGGLSGQFGTMFGMQKTKNILSTITKVLAVIIFVLALLVNRFFVGSTTTIEGQAVKPVTEGANVPASNIAPPPIQQVPETEQKK